VVIGTDCIGSCNFNYHTITATTPPPKGNDLKHISLPSIVVSARKRRFHIYSFQHENPIHSVAIDSK